MLQTLRVSKRKCIHTPTAQPFRKVILSVSSPWNSLSEVTGL